MNNISTSQLKVQSKTSGPTALNKQRVTEFYRDGLRFNVIDQGPLEGEAIVLLHGFPEMAESWQAVSSILNANGYRTYALEQRGYSLEASPRGRFSYSLDELTEDLHAFIKLIDQPVYLVGHDWGALVAGEYALKYPQHLKHLTLVSVPHKGAYVQAMLTSSQFLSSYYVAFFQLPFVPEIMFKHLPKTRNFFLKNSGMTPDQMLAFERDFVKEGRIGTAIHWYRSIVLSSPFKMFKKISVPTLFVWGDKDIAIKRKSADLNRNFFTGTYEHVYLKASHWIPTQNSEQLSQSILKAIKRG